MKRLTEKDPYWMGEEFWSSAEEPDDEEVDNVYHRLWEYENTGLEPEEILDLVKTANSLGARNFSGHSIRIGETVYGIFEDGMVHIGSVTAITIFENGEYTFWVSFDPEAFCGEFDVGEINETIFFTHEAAEEHKKMMEDNHEDIGKD